ncbi:hypothetical protein [Mucilaginibacter flavidus]|uniref:hypothetical protein n=1 Tax=Mucilaginibacter flavidus TaxID=2949309 RepID=UPI002093D886|nr:hypothetical protein [Mucilaginibacter flavidus]MCO5946312.1 hypothetical protein [Mucilaginibacter flavidus]
MSHRKPLIRRTFLQERYEILIKRQRDGKATFNELTELDDIVNRDPTIREIVLIENYFMPDNDDNSGQANPVKEIIKPALQTSFFDRLKDFLGRLFILPVAHTKALIV